MSLELVLVLNTSKRIRVFGSFAGRAADLYIFLTRSSTKLCVAP